VRSSVNLGQGDGQNRPEIKTFVSDNEGHIVFQFHDDGKSGTPEQREYLYANGNPWAETGHGVDGVQQTLIDTGKYNLIQNLGDSFPGGVLTYTTRDGDTLMAIAAQMYGNPSLWFVIADANGLNAGESLKAGRTLTIPNSVKTGTITAENHKVYSEGEIVGSTLPNLKTPPPPKPKKGCGSIIMIIIIVVIAVVASFFIGPVAGLLLQAALGTAGAAAAGIVATTIAYAVAGAIVAAVASIVQQGLFIALGYQDSFSWKQVGNAAIAGAITGAAQGLGEVAQAAKVAEAAGEATVISSSTAQIASAALKASGVAVKQILDGGKITSWTSIAAAAIGQYMSADVSEATKTVESAEYAGDTFTKAYDNAQAVLSLNSTIQYATPWVQLAETYVRNDGKLTPMDWAGAAGATFAQFAVDEFGAQGQIGRTTTGQLQNQSLRLGAELLVAGALRHYDKDAAQSYFENSVGQEAGTFIGDYIGQTIQPYLPEKPTINVEANSQFGGEGDDILLGGAGDDLLHDEYFEYSNPNPNAGREEGELLITNNDAALGRAPQNRYTPDDMLTFMQGLGTRQLQALATVANNGIYDPSSGTPDVTPGLFEMGGFYTSPAPEAAAAPTDAGPASAALAAVADDRMTPDQIKNKLYHGFELLFTASQYGGNTSYSPQDPETILQLRAEARRELIEGLTGLRDNPELAAEWLTSGKNALGKVGLQLKDLPDVFKATTGLALNGDPTNLEQATALGAGLQGIIKSSSAATGALFATLADSGDIGGVVNRLVEASALPNGDKGVTAWNNFKNTPFGALLGMAMGAIAVGTTAAFRAIGARALAQASQETQLAAEIAALRRIGERPKGPDLSTKEPNSVLYRQAEKISTAKPDQVTAPRDLNEQVLWNRVREDPAAGKPLPLADDPHFPTSEGFTKMQATHRLPDGSSITIHYQYNSVSGKAYDMKIITPQRPSVQPGPSVVE